MPGEIYESIDGDIKLAVSSEEKGASGESFGIIMTKLWEGLKKFATKDEKNIMLLAMIVCAIGICCSVMCMMICCRSKASEYEDEGEIEVA